MTTRPTTDPVCGMTVSEDSAAGRSEYQGIEYLFCGKSCLAKFEKDPISFVEKKRASEKTASPVGTVYTCPMHAEIQQDHPGACPKCGMALETLAPLPPKTKTEYTCPMHPQIVRDAPGNCPICGMALEPRTAVAHEKNPEL